MRRILAGTVFVSLSCFVSVPSAPAQVIDLKPNHSAVNLLYLQPLTALVSVEQSADLASWKSVSGAIAVLTQTKKDEVLRSTIPISALARKLFFRLRVENGWKVNLSWQASLSPGVTGYYLHYG